MLAKFGGFGIFVLAVSIVAACTPAPTPIPTPTPTRVPPTATPEPVVFADIRTLRSECTALAKQKRFAIINGTLELPTITFCGANSCNILIRQANPVPDGLGIVVLVGEGKNRMDRLYNNYTKENVKVHTQDGGTIGIGTPVTVVLHVETNEYVEGCSYSVLQIWQK